MKKNVLLLLMFVSFCELGYSQTKELKISYSTSTKVDGVENVVVVDSIVTDMYVELELQAMSEDGYICSHVYRKLVYKDSSNYTKYSRGILDKNGVHVNFLMKENFFNYMYDRGYEVLFEDKKKYGVRCVFKRISL